MLCEIARRAGHDVAHRCEWARNQVGIDRLPDTKGHIMRTANWVLKTVRQAQLGPDLGIARLEAADQPGQLALAEREPAWCRLRTDGGVLAIEPSGT